MKEEKPIPCKKCDEFRPLIANVCERCRELSKKRPILPKEDRDQKFTIKYHDKIYP